MDIPTPLPTVPTDPTFTTRLSEAISSGIGNLSDVGSSLTSSMKENMLARVRGANGVAADNRLAKFLLLSGGLGLGAGVAYSGLRDIAGINRRNRSGGESPDVEHIPIDKLGGFLDIGAELSGANARTLMEDPRAGFTAALAAAIPAGLVINHFNNVRDDNALIEVEEDIDAAKKKYRDTIVYRNKLRAKSASSPSELSVELDAFYEDMKTACGDVANTADMLEALSGDQNKSAGTTGKILNTLGLVSALASIPVAVGAYSHGRRSGGRYALEKAIAQRRTQQTRNRPLSVVPLAPKVNSDAEEEDRDLPSIGVSQSMTTT